MLAQTVAAENEINNKHRKATHDANIDIALYKDYVESRFKIVEEHGTPKFTDHS